MRLAMTQDQCREATTANLRENPPIASRPTPVEVQLTFGQRLRYTLPNYGVTPSRALTSDLKALLGPSAILG